MTDHVTKTIATYDQFAADWVSVAHDPDIDAWVKDSTRRFVKLLPGTTVLVPGCGDGRDSQNLAALGCKVESFDLSASMLAFARQRTGAGTFMQMDLRDLPSLQRRYAGIFASACLYHLTPSEFRRFIADAANLLEPDGVFFLNMKLGEGTELRRVPKDNYPGGAVARELLQGDRYYAYYSEAELDRMLTTGFAVNCKRRMAPHTEEVLEYLLVRKPASATR